MAAPATEPSSQPGAGSSLWKGCPRQGRSRGFGLIMDGYTLGEDSQPHVGINGLSGALSTGRTLRGHSQHGGFHILTGRHLEGAGWVLPKELVQTDDQNQTLRTSRPQIRHGSVPRMRMSSWKKLIAGTASPQQLLVGCQLRRPTCGLSIASDQTLNHG